MSKIRTAAIALGLCCASAAANAQGFEADFGGCGSCYITNWPDNQYSGPIAFPHTMFNENNVWNPATAKYTPVPPAGMSVYVICAWQAWVEGGAAQSGNPQFVMKMIRNGGGADNPKTGEWSGIGVLGSIPGTAIMQGNAVVHMNAGDYLQWILFSNAEPGQSLLVNADQPHTYVSCAAIP